MAQPTSRDELKQYCLRQLGAPVLEINVATEQCEDLIDDAIQIYNERHYDGVAQVYLKYKITHTFINGNLVYKNGKFNENKMGSLLTFNS